MKRLTYFDGGKWRIKIGDTEYSGAVADRLAAYEETDLEPEEFISAVDTAKIAYVLHELNAYMARIVCALHELNAYKELGPIDRLRELAQADKDGKFPEYTIGDIIYARFGMAWTVDSLEYVQCTYEKKWLYRCGHPETDDYRGLYQDEVLTRAEAADALRREQDEKGGSSE